MKNKRERGSYTIEATLTLTIFMFAYLAIVSLATVARVESITQYAIDQAAKEVSQYYYLAERLLPNISNNDGSETVDAMVQAVADFADSGKKTYSSFQSIDPNAYGGDISTSAKQLMGDVGEMKNNVTDLTAKASSMYNALEPAFEDPKGIITTLVPMLVQQAETELISRLVAQPLCKALVPKYIAGDRSKSDAMLTKMGVVDGLDGLDFRMSNFLRDGRSVNVVLVYQVKPRGYGLIDHTITIKQTASTAAWVTGKKLSEVAEEEKKASLWEQPDLTRGTDFVAKEKEEQKAKACDPGSGIDLYDKSTGTFSSVHSLNVFAASYSDYNNLSGKDNDATDYTLKTDKVRNTINGYLTKLEGNVDSINTGDIIKMADSTNKEIEIDKNSRKKEIILYVPEEAKKNADMKAALEDLAKEYADSGRAKVTIKYEQPALGAPSTNTGGGS